MPTNAEIIQIGKISQYLAGSDQATGRMYRGSSEGVVDIQNLYLTTKVIDWMNGSNPADSGLTAACNYLLGLCGAYIQRAIIILGNAGSIIINPQTGQPGNLSYQASQFLVSAGMSAPYNSYTLVDSNIVLGSLFVTVDGTEIPYGAFADRVSYTASYTSYQVVITFNSNLSPTSLIRITYVKTVPAS